MKISQHSVVTFSYVLSDDQGNELERADAASPTAYLHGGFNIMVALEDAFEGKTMGDQFGVDLSAKQAYGERQQKALLRVPLKKLKSTTKGKLRKGAHVQFEHDKQMIDGSIVKLGKFNADIDTNHPLAGKNLHFDIHVIEVREATDVEISHGHAHGVGGHHH
jgi:FKBP-type peptidyl-prolyl cis-trans isomerase SlyD